MILSELGNASIFVVFTTVKWDV